MKRNSGVYKIINLINGDFYLGSSIELDNRFRRHFYNLDKNKHSSIKLQRAYNKYGKRNFIFHVVEYCSPDKCLELEQFYLNSCLGNYNIALNSFAPMTGRKHSEKTRKKLKGRECWNKGIPRTEEEKELMSEMRKVAHENMSQEKREEWINNLKNNASTHWLGKNISEESKEKISSFWKNKNDYNLLCEQNNKIYSTQLEAAKDLKVKQGHLSEHLNGKRKTVSGYTFRKILKNV